MTIERVRQAFAESARNFEALMEAAPQVAAAADIISQSLQQGGKILFCGNGGSASDAQHLAAELVGRYLLERNPLPGLALTANSSTVTAIGNDYGFDDIFARQVRGLGRPGDVLVALSTSGNSRNIVAAVDAGRALGLRSIGLTGAGGGQLTERCELCIRVPSTHTPRIQEMHIAVGHMICELVECTLA